MIMFHVNLQGCRLFSTRNTQMLTSIQFAKPFQFQHVRCGDSGPALRFTRRSFSRWYLLFVLLIIQWRLLRCVERRGYRCYKCNTTTSKRYQTEICRLNLLVLHVLHLNYQQILPCYIHSAILLMVQKSCTTWNVYKTLWKKWKNNGINYQPQLVSRISEPSTSIKRLSPHLEETRKTTSPPSKTRFDG